MVREMTLIPLQGRIEERQRMIKRLPEHVRGFYRWRNITPLAVSCLVNEHRRNGSQGVRKEVNLGRTK